VKDIFPRRVMDRLWPCYCASSLKLFEICLLSTTIRKPTIAVAIPAAQWLCGLSRSSRMCSCLVLEISRMLETITTAVKTSIRARSLISRHQSAGGPKIDLLCLLCKTLPMTSKCFAVQESGVYSDLLLSVLPSHCCPHLSRGRSGDIIGLTPSFQGFPPLSVVSNSVVMIDKNV
jgi:hypothetical protein